MPHAFHDIAFTPSVKSIQSQLGSRDHYANYEAGETHHDALGGPETAFVRGRDSFYMASVSETGWPYMQHRGGTPGFVKVVDEQTLAWAEYPGNDQYITTGNLAGSNKVALFFMDYSRKARLKIFGHARVVDGREAQEFEPEAQRAIIVRLVGFEWNCPKYITQRHAHSDVEGALAQMGARIAELEAQLAAQ